MLVRHSNPAAPPIVSNRGVLAESSAKTSSRKRDLELTLLSTAFPLAVKPSLYKSLPYNTERDFGRSTNYGQRRGTCSLSPDVPAKSVKSLIARRSSPTPLRFSSPHRHVQPLAAELFALKLDHAHHLLTKAAGGHDLVRQRGEINFLPVLAPATALIQPASPRSRVHRAPLPAMPYIRQSLKPACRLLPSRRGRLVRPG